MNYKIINELPQLPQRQDSTLDQLIDLAKVGNRLGLYDAVDVIMKLINKDKNII